MTFTRMLTVLCAALAFGLAARAEAAPDSLVGDRPVREARPVVLSLTGDLDFPRIGQPGLQIAWNPGAHFALDLGYGTLGYWHKISAGLRALLLKHVVSPYFYLRGGAFLVGIGEVGAVGFLSPGLGVEVSTRSGFNLFFEAGGEGFNAVWWTGRIGMGVGYRW